jgi:hypothetical protein
MAARGYVVNGNTIAPPVPVSNAAEEVRPTATRSSIETRLGNLKQLHHDGLITNKEYRDRRQRILSDL